MKRTIRIGLILAVGGCVAAWFMLDLGQYLDLAYVQGQQEAVQSMYKQQPAAVVAAYMAVYILVTGLSLPGATIITLFGGGIFGLVAGTVIVSFASTAGATLAFLLARFVLRDWVQQRFQEQLAGINQGIEKDGALYLLSLRLIPAIPFWMINLLMGLTPIRLPVYWVVSQLGMLAGTIVYVNAGTQLAQIDTLAGILEPAVLGSFVLLGLVPLVLKGSMQYLQRRKVYAGYQRPAQYDYNLVAIGAGAGGLVTAYIGAAAQAKVALVEKHKMGGDCLNTGCVPSKALIRSAKFVAEARRSETLGIRKADIEFDFAEIMQRVQRIVTTIEPHDSVERYTELGVDVIQGEARILSPWEVQVGERILTTRNIVVATGARPFVPPIPGIESIEYLTSDNLWDLRKLPEKLVVLGGGPIGSELTQAFARLGSQVTQVELLDRILVREDPEISALVTQQLQAEGVTVLTDHKAVEVVHAGTETFLACQHNDQTVHIPFDQLLVAVGRTPNVQGFGLEELGVELGPRGTVQVDEHLRTNIPNIYAVGDVAGPYQFTHTAAHMAWYAAVNAMAHPFYKARVDYRVIPWATFTDPEVARVGLNEQEALQQGIACEVTTYGIDDLDRAIADESAHGIVKVLTRPGKDEILGVTIAGPHAGDLIAEFVQAMKYGIGLNKVLGTIHIYPTLAEANKYAAGAWKRAHVNPRLLGLARKFHTWRR